MNGMSDPETQRPRREREKDQANEVRYYHLKGEECVQAGKKV